MLSAQTFRERGKRGLGWLAARGLPNCQYGNCIFVLAHMRCGSTALSNILCSRPDVVGYGETHVRHDGLDAPGRLAVNCLRRGGWKRAAPYQFDKILHSRLDGRPPPEFFEAKAIFLVREPNATIRSIVNLFRKLGRNEYQTDLAAAEYYIERLDALAASWERFAPSRRVGLTYHSLLIDPDAALSRISSRLAIVPALENRYQSLAASRRGGGGDPLVSGQHSRIEPCLATPQVSCPDLAVPAAVMQAVNSRYRALADLFDSDALCHPRDEVAAVD